MATETVTPASAQTDPPVAEPEHLTRQDRIELLRAMLAMRGIEQRAMSLYRQGKVPGSFYDGYGQEAVSAGAAFAMAAEDRLCILHRDLAAHLIRGVEPQRIFAQYMGRADGITAGRDGNVHFGDRKLGCVGMVSMLPDMMLVAAGMAMAFKLRGEPRCALTWFGDGSTSRGDFHEAMNWAGVQKLPVVFVLENNQYAYSTPLDKQFAVDPVQRATAYGFEGVSVDGNDVEAMFEATRAARERAIAGGGPTLIEAVTMRMHGHAAHDDMKYVPNEQVEEWKQRDPIDRQEQRLQALGVDVDELRADDRRTSSTPPSSRRSQARCPPPRTCSTASSATARRSRSATATPPGAASRGVMPDADDDLPAGDLKRAARRAARRRARAADGRGHRRVRRRLQGDRRALDEFGADRVMDTPLAESAIIGTAVGAAVVGLRPVCEMQFSDFISCGFDQLVNVAGKMHYRQGLAVPIVVRLPSGGGFSGGPFHSQNPEAWFMHAPGLKVVAPSTAHDAKGLLHAAIRDPNPVCFMEHKHLYRRVKGDVPEGVYETPFTARVARAGEDLVVIAYGAMVDVALEATDDLDGARVEVLDLRSLVPLDTAAILDSVKRCSKVVIVDEANMTCAAGAQVAALIAEHGFEDLDGPVVRVATPDVPIPFSPPLEQAVLPGVERVKEACRELLAY